MKYLKYFTKDNMVTADEISDRPLVYYIEETDTLVYHNNDDTPSVLTDIGSISDDNILTLNTDTLSSGDYTLSYANAEGEELTSWMDITKFTI